MRCSSGMEITSLRELPELDLVYSFRPAADQFELVFATTVAPQAFLGRGLTLGLLFLLYPSGIQLRAQVGTLPGASRALIILFVFIIQIWISYCSFKSVKH